MGACILYHYFLPSLYPRFWYSTLCVLFLSALLYGRSIPWVILDHCSIFSLLARPVSLDKVSCIRDHVPVKGSTCLPHTRESRRCRCPSAVPLRVPQVKAMRNRKYLLKVPMMTFSMYHLLSWVNLSR